MLDHGTRQPGVYLLAEVPGFALVLTDEERDLILQLLKASVGRPHPRISYRFGEAHRDLRIKSTGSRPPPRLSLAARIEEDAKGTELSDSTGEVGPTSPRHASDGATPADAFEIARRVPLMSPSP